VDRVPSFFNPFGYARNVKIEKAVGFIEPMLAFSATKPPEGPAGRASWYFGNRALANGSPSSNCILSGSIDSAKSLLSRSVQRGGCSLGRVLDFTARAAR
jgi:hypothetical protein